MALASGCSDSDKSSASDDNGSTTTSVEGASEAGPLLGTFAIDAAVCTDGVPTSGSYFRMVQSGGTIDAGPFVPNADSLCGDKSYSALLPGTAGLVTGEFQPQPAEPFDAAGNGLAGAIVARSGLRIP